MESEPSEPYDCSKNLDFNRRRTYTDIPFDLVVHVCHNLYNTCLYAISLLVSLSDDGCGIRYNFRMLTQLRLEWLKAWARELLFMLHLRNYSSFVQQTPCKGSGVLYA